MYASVTNAERHEPILTALVSFRYLTQIMRYEHILGTAVAVGMYSCFENFA